MHDPYLAVKEEVAHSVSLVDQLHQKWKALLPDNSSTTHTPTDHIHAANANDDDAEWTASELLSGLRSIEWDLQDLDDTIAIVENAPHKFHIEPPELDKRKDFIAQTRLHIARIKDEVQAAAGATEPSSAQPQGAGSGFSTKGASSTRGLPSVGAKAKGYGKVLDSDDAEGGGARALDMSAELRVADGGGGGRRHRRKKLCCGVVVLAMLIVVASVLFRAAKADEVQFSGGAAAPS